MNFLIEIASRELGIRELHGKANNERILQYAHELGIDWVNHDETPWCSIFINWVANQAGLETTGSALARSWLKVGKKIENPIPGDVVIFWREKLDSNKGHVGLFLGYTKDPKRIFVLGGNQGDAVSIKEYPSSRLLGIRRLRPVAPIELPKRALYYGDYGLAVVKLQEALAHVGYFQNLVDGNYDNETYDAVWLLQYYSEFLETTGNFDLPTHDFLQGLLEINIDNYAFVE